MDNQNDQLFLEMSMKELTALLGEHLLTEALGSKPFSDSEKRKAGKNWFKYNIDDLRRIICNNELIQSQLRNGVNKDRNMLFAAVVDIIASSYGTLPVAALAAMTIHYGIDKLCIIE